MSKEQINPTDYYMDHALQELAIMILSGDEIENRSEWGEVLYNAANVIRRSRQVHSEFADLLRP